MIVLGLIGVFILSFFNDTARQNNPGDVVPISVQK